MKRIIYFLFFINSLHVFAQDLPPIINFELDSYNAQNQNWGISQTDDKSIFVANNRGLLEYNGANWKLYNSPNNTIIRSVKAVGDKIYTGSYMDFGYWQRDKVGGLKYTSLTENISNNFIDDEQFWTILHVEESILFQSLNSIYIYNLTTEKFRTISSDVIITKMFKTDNDEVYFQKLNKGLFKIENGKEVLVSDNKILKNNRIVNVFNHNNSFLVLTQKLGFFEIKNNQLLPWRSVLNSENDISVYSAVKLRDQTYVLGTISEGLIYINQSGNKIYQINQDNGLNDNTVLSLFEDNDNNIWLGLDNGINVINQNSTYRVYNDYHGKIGSVYTSIIHNNYLFLGTNQGLFYRELDSNLEFKLISNTQGQVWKLRLINNTLFCGHDLGTFIIKGTKAERVSNILGAWDFKEINEATILQGNYDGFYILQKNNLGWQLKNKVKNYGTSSRYFDFVSTNEVLVSHEYKGVSKVIFNDDFSAVKSSYILNIDKGLNSSLAKFKGDIYYAFNKGVYKFYNTENKFKKDSTLSSVFEDGFVTGKLLVDNFGMWAFCNNHLVQIKPSKLSENISIKKIPLQSASRNSVVGYEEVLSIDKDKILVGSTKGYIVVNTSAAKPTEFEISINSIDINTTKKDGNRVYINSSEKNNFKNDENNLEFFYNVPQYSKFKQAQYQYKLTGIYDNWSTWSANASVVFENLPSGDYEFIVRAKVGDNLTKNNASYKFSIDKPWYYSNVMILVYGISIILFSLFMHMMYRRYYKKQQETIIAQNEKEIRLARAENEREIIKIRNEKLRQDYKEKSKELASSVMNVVRKNEILTEVKNNLSKIEAANDVKSIIRFIDKNLNQNKDWEYFQEAFNNVDSEFISRIKAIHPNLTTNDLKLCTYLRLNLTSKEIAPLFNISVRSLEIKRYRLRKKINLPHEKNLADYILEL